MAEPPGFLSRECQKALELYQSFLLGETAYYDEDMGMDTTIAPAPSSAYTLFDITGDGLPELMTLAVVRQYRDRSFEIVSTFTGGGIYSYKDGAIPLWYDCLTHPFEILRNRALLFQYDHGDGGYYFDYIELDAAGCVIGETHGVKLTYWKKLTHSGSTIWMEKKSAPIPGMIGSCLTRRFAAIPFPGILTPSHRQTDRRSYPLCCKHKVTLGNAWSTQHVREEQHDGKRDKATPKEADIF